MDLFAKKLQRAALATIDRSSKELARGVTALESVTGMAYHEKWGANICWVLDRIKGQAKDGVESMALAGAVTEQSTAAGQKLNELTSACSVVKDATALPTPSNQITSVMNHITPVKIACIELSDGLHYFSEQMSQENQNRERDSNTHRERQKMDPGKKGL